MSSSEVGIRDLVNGFEEIGLTRESKVIVHSSLSSFGQVRGGAVAVLAALLHTCDTVVMPAFTYQSMVWPSVGPSDNGIDYKDPQLARLNEDASLFHSQLPVHPDVGAISDTLQRLSTFAIRSSHPVLSFVAMGEHMDEALAPQTIEDPLAPLQWLQHNSGDVLLIGVGHTRNTSIHLAEKLANRKQFTRWAITLNGDSEKAYAMRLPNYPGCSDGFDTLEPEIQHTAKQITIGDATIQRVPLMLMIPIIVGWIEEEPDALLCSRPDCQRCHDLRRAGNR